MFGHPEVQLLLIVIVPKKRIKKNKIHHDNLCQVLFIAIVCLSISWNVQKHYQQIVMKCPVVQCYDTKNKIIQVQI